jgi:putative ATPase
MKELGYGKGYKYPHDFPDHYVDENYLPDDLKGRVYYRPTNQGYEGEIRKKLDTWRKGKG